MTSPRAGRPEARPRGLAGRALVWKRFDFRESSRVVVLWTRDHGLVSALAKGAHRDSSPLRGRIDFLAELEVQLSATREGLRTLLRAELVRERRALRQPDRFLAANHLTALFDAALVPDRSEPELFDLADGGLTLIARCPTAALPVVVLGLELRLLAALGSLPDLEACSACGRPLAEQVYEGEVAGALACRDHASAPRRAVGARALAFVRAVLESPGRDLPTVPGPVPPAAVALSARWLQRSLERSFALRPLVYRRRELAAVDADA